MALAGALKHSEEAFDGFASFRMAEAVEDWAARARKLDRTAEIVEDEDEELADIFARMASAYMALHEAGTDLLVKFARDNDAEA